MTAKTVDASFMSAFAVRATNLTGCGEMSNYTFSVTVTEQGNKIPHFVDEDFMRLYLATLIESKGDVQVLNIVRDY